MEYIYNDGGRSNYFKGSTRDCVVRAIAIASDMDYKEVYDLIHQRQKEWANKSRSKAALRCRKNPSPRAGVWKQVYIPIIEELGFRWVSTCEVGSSDRTYLSRSGSTLPKGTLIVKTRRPLQCVKDHILYYTHSSFGNMVYGYWIKS